MPALQTAREACAELDIKTRATLRKWMGKLGITPQEHAWDKRYTALLTPEDVARIREARDSRPALAQLTARTRTNQPLRSKPATPTRHRGEHSNNLANPSRRAHFLAQHGWPFNTTRGWRECPLRSREAVLRYAVEHDQRLGHRATYRGRVVHECGESDCPCHAVMQR